MKVCGMKNLATFGPDFKISRSVLYREASVRCVWQVRSENFADKRRLRNDTFQRPRNVSDYQR